MVKQSDGEKKTNKKSPQQAEHAACLQPARPAPPALPQRGLAGPQPALSRHGATGPHLKGDGLPREGLHEDLHVEAGTRGKEAVRGGRAGATRGNGAELGRVPLAEWRRAERAAGPHARGFSSAGRRAGRGRDGGKGGGAGSTEGCRELEFLRERGRFCPCFLDQTGRCGV